MYGFFFFAKQIPVIHFFLVCLSYGVVLWLLNSKEEPAFIICWLLFLLPFPIVGGSIFFLLRGQGMSKKEKKSIQNMKNHFQTHLSPLFLENVQNQEDVQPQIYFLQTQTASPAYENTKTTYFASGEEAFPHILSSLKKAKYYIFLEYFLLAEGVFWEEILSILKEKSKNGIEVRLIYDDAGCFFSLPKNYPKILETYGIKAKVFHPLYPVLSTKLNHRDHRKILIIDGTMAITGGINLADEYINQKKRFGHWKDSVIMLEGKAVFTMILSFLTMWEYCDGKKENFSKFFPKNMPFFQVTSLVLPYNNIPLEAIGQQVFLNLITRAKKYIHLTSPYLILDTACQTALSNAAKSGIEVMIITPQIPDKKLVFQVTQAFYPLLQEAGVEIYQYTPGFIHGKTAVIDGIFATVGTINLDFRSLFLHFENGVWLWNAPCIAHIEEDFQKTLALSTRQEKSKKDLLGSFLRIFSPLM
ncbi:MAG: cardiolipin synthase [Eubacteriales bacterium]